MNDIPPPPSLSIRDFPMGVVPWRKHHQETPATPISIPPDAMNSNDWSLLACNVYS